MVRVGVRWRRLGIQKHTDNGMELSKQYMTGINRNRRDMSRRLDQAVFTCYQRDGGFLL